MPEENYQKAAINLNRKEFKEAVSIICAVLSGWAFASEEIHYSRLQKKLVCVGRDFSQCFNFSVFSKLYDEPIKYSICYSSSGKCIDWFCF